MKHTQGPWVWDEELTSDYDTTDWKIHAPWLVADFGMTNVLEGQICCGNPADAYLIAAAPDLYALAECEEALDSDTEKGIAVLESYGWSYKDRFDLPATEFVKRMRKRALAKAKGESK